MGISEQNQTAEVSYGPGFKPDKMSKKPIIVEITSTKHKGKQRWVFAIDKPGKGSKETNRQRYASASNARRAAAAELKGFYSPGQRVWFAGWEFKGRVIEFVTNKKK